MRAQEAEKILFEAKQKISLQEGEEILFEAKPENKILVMWFFSKVMPAIILWVAIFLGVFFYAMQARGQKQLVFELLKLSYTLFMPSVVCITSLYYRILKETYHYYVTNQRCIYKGGIIVRRKRDVPFHKINDTEINQNLFERMLGIYSLKIFTPDVGSVGLSGSEKVEITFFGLKDAETPAKIIQDILSKHKVIGE